jgi:hypothetical protein
LHSINALATPTIGQSSNDTWHCSVNSWLFLKFFAGFFVLFLVSTSTHYNIEYGN